MNALAAFARAWRATRNPVELQVRRHDIEVWYTSTDWSFAALYQFAKTAAVIGPLHWLVAPDTDPHRQTFLGPLPCPAS